MKFKWLLFLLLLQDAVLFAQNASLLASIRQDSAISLYLTQDWKQIEKHKKDKAYQDGFGYHHHSCQGENQGQYAAPDLLPASAQSQV